MAILDLRAPAPSLRLSVTDRCNLRCHYCMPEPDYAWLPKDTLSRSRRSARSPTCSATSASTVCA